MLQITLCSTARSSPPILGVKSQVRHKLLLVLFVVVPQVGIQTVRVNHRAASLRGQIQDDRNQQQPDHENPLAVVLHSTTNFMVTRETIVDVTENAINHLHTIKCHHATALVALEHISSSRAFALQRVRRHHSGTSCNRRQSVQRS